MSSEELARRLVRGAAAGFAGTLALQVVLTASQKWLPATIPSFQQDPGEFMVEKAEEALPAAIREHMPAPVEIAAAKSLAVGYGLIAGASYASLCPNGGNVIVDWVVLGLGVWAAGYLGWLPALGLVPGPRGQGLAVLAGEATRHVLFGIATVDAYRWLHNRAS